MKKKITCLLYFFLLQSTVCVYSQNIETVIKTQAMEMARAVLARDVDKLVIYLPPKLVADAGGRDRLLVARDTLNKYMKQFGAEIKKVLIGDPGKIIFYKNQLQTTLPQTTSVKFMAGLVILESTLVAISDDKGRHWYFIDTGIYHGEKLKASLPDLSPELVIPPLKKPRIVPDEQ
ncbi:MAG: hypothetical protein ABI813_04945 [Bacteroidota bacterium]